MKIKFIYIIIPAVIVVVAHFSAVMLGLYQGKVWVDIPLHFIFGILLGLFWLWVLQRLGMPFEAPSRFLIGTTIVSFALLGSFIWELFEFSFWKLLPSYATILKIYSSTVSDVLSDLLAGLIGGITTAVIYAIKSK